MAKRSRFRSGSKMPSSRIDRAGSISFSSRAASYARKRTRDLYERATAGGRRTFQRVGVASSTTQAVASRACPERGSIMRIALHDSRRDSPRPRVDPSCFTHDADRAPTPRSGVPPSRSFRPAPATPSTAGRSTRIARPGAWRLTPPAARVAPGRAAIPCMWKAGTTRGRPQATRPTDRFATTM